jgi:hypothetical protein
MIAIIHSRLEEVVFARFHPSLNTEQSKIVGDIYKEIRQEGIP